MKQLTVKETYEQALRAITRLRCKELICGPMRMDTRCCVYGAMKIHSKIRGVVENIATIKRLSSDSGRYDYNSFAVGGIIEENEQFLPDENSSWAARGRYKHVEKFIKKQIRAFA